MDINSLVALTQGQSTSVLATSEENETTETVSDTTSESTQTTTTSERSGEEFTTFLTLLTAQIRNQDPLAPLDSTQFVEQLATFSNLELQAEGNAVLEDIALTLAESVYATTPQSEPTT